MFCKFSCGMLVKPCSSVPFPTKTQNSVRATKAVCVSYRCIAEYFAQRHSTLQYSCACATVNSSLLLFCILTFYASCFIFSRLCWVSHYVRHNNSASLIEQWHTCHRYLDLAVVLSSVRRLWKRSDSRGFEVALQCASLTLWRLTTPVRVVPHR